MIALILPNLALGQTVVLTPVAEDKRQVATPTAVVHKSPRLQQSSAHPRMPSKTWLRQHTVSVVSIGLTLITGWYAFTLRAANQGLTEANNSLSITCQSLLKGNSELTKANQSLNGICQSLVDVNQNLTKVNQSLETTCGAKEVALQSLNNRVVELEKTHSEVLKEYEGVSTQQGEALKEANNSIALLGQAKEQLEEVCRAQAEQLQSYKNCEQELLGKQASVEEKHKEIQERIEAVQMREQQSQERLKVLEGREKAITQQDAEIESHLQALKIEKTQLESQASIFAKLIRETRDL
jgi:chromosome segregation ATPase